MLKFPPIGRRIIAGFVTTNTSELKGMDWLRKQFEAASQYVDMDQLGIAPQCDFASTEDGNAIIEKDSGW
ncbi:hypothetical protein HFO27_34205 [Rhizobium leguminosarum]|uniref:hypothetical protein n=1 Tax=Rhizobium leguminosarum TaxID=384 RepID=UPI001C92A7F4|nr:hypothetical protein [Rhizobium leguminosarum]MBY3179563.1 hypothetical protein [Rhizobium leguminosarum]